MWRWTRPLLVSSRVSIVVRRWYTTKPVVDDPASALYRSTVNPKIHKYLKSMLVRYSDLQNQLHDQAGRSSDELRKIANQVNELYAVAEKYSEFSTKRSELCDLHDLLKEAKDDADMTKLVKADIDSCVVDLAPIERDLLKNLVPSDHLDRGNAILEVRAGAGGAEAQLFALQLFRMYNNYAISRGWKWEDVSVAITEVGGVREATAWVSGPGVFGSLKFESGVHRVQRVPETESLGRVHTSTVTAAILPEVTEVEAKVNEKELKIELFRSSGNGGQSVNTTDSAVRITHLPTGVTVSMQDERSQIKNKEKAMKILRSRLYELESERLHAERSATRSKMVGSGSRSERIRTYNFPQNRLTDHRAGIDSHNLDDVMTGDDELHSFLEDIAQYFQARSLETLEEEEDNSDEKNG